MTLRNRCHFRDLALRFLPRPGRKFSTLAPSLIAVAICGFGTASICAYQRSIISMKPSMSLSRARAVGADARRRARRRPCRPSAPRAAGSISRSLRPAAMRRNISQMSVSASKWSRRSPRIGTRRIRFQPSSSLIELETLERASAERVGDLVGGERPLGKIEQRVDLADRAVDAPLPAHLAPVQHEALQREREGFPVVGNFCHDRNI